MADKRIDELEEALTITSNDLFVLEQASTAKKLTGQTMTTFLTALADGHGGIQTIEKTSSTGTNPVIDTYTVTFADTSTTTFNVTNGVKGDRGATGPQGPKGDNATITSTSVQYQAWSSGVSYPTGTWVDNVPAVGQGEYLWTRTIVNYLDGAQTVSYSVSRMGVDGSGAVSTVNSVLPDGSGNVQLTASDVGALPASYQAPVTSVNGQTGDVVVSAGVTSVNTKTGAVVLAASDVGAKPLFKMSAELSSSGWYRIANIADTMLGSVLEFGIYIPYSVGSGQERAEVHRIKYPMAYGANAIFSDEYSAGDTLLIDKIRRTYGGTTDGVSTWGFDIHYTGNSAMDVYAELSGGNLTTDSLYLEDLASVSDAPSGETVYPEHKLSQRTEGDISSLCSFSKTSGNSGIDSFEVARRGNNINIHFHIKFSGAVSAGGDFWVGTANVPLPINGASAASYYSGRVLSSILKNDGSIVMRYVAGSGSFSSGNETDLYFNYTCD